MKIALYRANALGDLVVSLPALRAIRHHFEDAHIIYVGVRMHQELAQLIPTDEVTAIDQFVPKDLDLAIQMHGGGAQSNLLVKSWGALESVGFQAPGTPPLDRNLPYTYFQHEVMRFLELAAFVGATDLDPLVQVLPSGERIGPVVIHPGATDRRRRWPIERFVEVASHIDQPMVAIGNESEWELCEELTRVGATNLAGQLLLTDLMELIHDARLVIANDSGPRHLAEALGTPSVGIYWIGNLVNHGPLFREIHRTCISWRLNCPECQAPALLSDGTGMPRCAHDQSFVSEIDVGAVLDQVNELLLHSYRDEALY